MIDSDKECDEKYDGVQPFERKVKSDHDNNDDGNSNEGDREAVAEDLAFCLGSAPVYVLRVAHALGGLT